MTKVQVNVRLSAECQALLDAAADAHGGKAQAIEAALKLLANAPSSAGDKIIRGLNEAVALSTNDKPEVDLPAALEAAARELRSLRRIAKFAKP